MRPAKAGRRSAAADRPDPVDAEPSAGESRQLWKIAAELIEDAVIAMDLDGRITGWSTAAQRLLGWDRAEAADLLANRLFVDLADDADDCTERLLHPAERRLGLLSVRARDGSVIPVTVMTAALPDGGGVCAVLRDRSALTRAEEERERAIGSARRQQYLWELLQRITAIANEATDLSSALHRCLLEICAHLDQPFGHAVVLSEDGEGHSVNIWHAADRSGMEPLRLAIETGLETGLARRALLTGQPVWVPDLASQPDPAAEMAVEAGLTNGFAFPIVFDSQVVALVETLGTTEPERVGLLLTYARHCSVQLGRVIERERSRDLLSHQALHDDLTGLPNRTLFVERLGHVLRGLGPGGKPIAVLIVDLDDFKLINDSLGHDIGDHVLRTVAGRLVTVMRPGDTVARFGGDEFVILCERLPIDDAVGDIADHVLDVLAQPMDLDGDAKAFVTASIGIALAAEGDARPLDLIRDADAAVYQAKEEGRGHFHVFGRALHERASLKLAIGNELRRAVANSEFRLVYQPQFRISDGRLIGVEALARWDHPERGILPPGDWIPVAEENEQIVPIGNWIVQEACEAAARWSELAQPDGDEPHLKMCVNVSAVQLARPELVDTVVAALHSTGINPANLCLEVTESLLMGQPGTYLEALLGLKLLGLSIAVDDFGTGYSSLAYLRRFPIDILKVDKGFVEGLNGSDQRGRAVLRAVVNLSDALGVQAVAEGVETEEQARLLADSGCYAAQGFFFGRPQSRDSITQLLSGAPA